MWLLEEKAVGTVPLRERAPVCLPHVGLQWRGEEERVSPGSSLPRLVQAELNLHHCRDPQTKPDVEAGWSVLLVPQAPGRKARVPLS